jgi:hypothetical protein
MKKLLLASLLLSAAAPALATELNPDPAFNTPSAYMLDPATGNPWTVSGGVAHGNGALGGKMLMGMNPAFKRGKTYHWQLTVPTMTHGVLRVVIGPTMTGSVAGSWVGLQAPIADNFPTANSLVTTGDMGEDVAGPDGAFRIECASGAIENTDPVVFPGLYGRSHTHESWGNTNSLDVRGSVSFYRTTGGSTCGNAHSQDTPADRAAYWMPAMTDGKGHVVRPIFHNQYYKGYSPTSSVCTTPADPNYALGAGGQCVNIPTGLKMISGYDFATGLGGPSDNGQLYYTCEGEGTYKDTHGGSVRSQHLKDFFHGGCALPGQGGNLPGQGGIISIKVTMAWCWDGLHSDSPNHRDHVAYGVRANAGLFGGCDDAHPDHFPAPNPLTYFIIDQNFYDGYWHLVSDEMVPGMVANDPGGTLHMDFTNAWSPPVLNAWYANCITGPKSCAHGGLGNGDEIKDGVIIASTMSTPPDPPYNAGAATSRYFPMEKIGMGKPITAPGTYSGEIVADADGRFGLMAVEDLTGAGFDGTVDNFSIVEVPSGHKGATTIHN